jgi:hypothetical protein
MWKAGQAKGIFGTQFIFILLQEFGRKLKSCLENLQLQEFL